jgi:hypothetical protein
MKKQSVNYHPRQDAYMAAHGALRAIECENVAWVTDNLCMVVLPALALHLDESLGGAKVWVENDPIFGLSYYSINYLKGECAHENQTDMDARDLSGLSVATLRDAIEKHWDSPESKRLRETRASIENLMEGGDAGDHPAVKAISAIVEAL